MQKIQQNTIFGSHFVFGHFEAFKVTGEGDRHQKWTQRTQIMIKKKVVCQLSPKMPLTFYRSAFIRFLTSINPTKRNT